MQYVDLLLCVPLEPSIQAGTKVLSNFLAERGYKVSQQKAQSSETSVKYLGLILLEGTRRLGKDRIQPVVLYPVLKKLLRQLRGVLGPTGYCHLWISGYGEVARSLYQLIKNTQATNTHLLLWDTESKQAFRKLKLILLGAPSLRHIGNSWNLYYREKVGSLGRFDSEMRPSTATSGVS